VAVTAYDTDADGTDDQTEGHESWYSDEEDVEFGAPQPPSIGTFEPHGGSGSVGQWMDSTTTYTDPNCYEDIALAFFFLDRQPPITNGGLAVAYYGPANLLILLGGGACQPGDSQFLTTPFVALDCGNTTVSGVGDMLTINWHVRPERCFQGGCGWNYAVELVTDSTGLHPAGLVGWWRLVPASGPIRSMGPRGRPTEVDLERLREEIEAWQSQLGERYPIRRSKTACSRE